MYLALYTDAGKVWIITVDFQQKLGEYEVKTKTQPADVQWCGNDSVLISWEDEVQLIGPNGSTIRSVKNLYLAISDSFGQLLL